MFNALPLSLGDTLLLSLADNLSAPIDPVASDPAQLMIAAGLAPDGWQAELLQSAWQRALLLCSRQAGKSTVTAALSAHTAIYKPDSLTLLLSPGLRQSGELLIKVREFYHALPNAAPIRRESALQMELANGSRIVALPGKEQTVRGYSGVDLLVVDEASRVSDELYFSIRPMLAVSGGRLIALSTPFGKRGFFFDEWTQGGGDWKRTKITAAQVPRITQAFLDEERRALGSLWYAQEYYCDFVDAVNSVFTHDQIAGAFSSEILPLFG